VVIVTSDIRRMRNASAMQTAQDPWFGLGDIAPEDKVV
jgi:hypothetical protein